MEPGSEAENGLANGAKLDNTSDTVVPEKEGSEAPDAEWTPSGLPVSYNSQNSRMQLIIGEEVAVATKDGQKKQGEKKRRSCSGKDWTPALVIAALTVVGLLIVGAILTGVLVSRARSLSDGNNAEDVPTSPPATELPGGLTPNDGTCETEGCLTLARMLQENIDDTVDPCENFYNFSCGGWIKNAKLPPGAASYNPLSTLSKRVELEVLRLLENDSVESLNEAEAVRKARALFRLCKDTDAIDAEGVQPIMDLLGRTGGWNLIDGGRAGPWSINDSSFAQGKLYSSSSFFQLWVDVDNKNSSRYIIRISQGHLSLNGFYYFTNDVPQLERFKDYFVRVMSLLNSTVPEQTYRTAVDGIVDFERNLVYIQKNPALLNDVNTTYNKMTLRSLTNLWPDYDWVNSFQYIFLQYGVQIDGEEEVIVEVPSYFSKLSQLFQSTSLETLENYDRWHLVLQYLTHLSRPILEARYEYEDSIESNRSLICLKLVRNIFPIAITRPYIEKVFPRGSVDKIRKMVDIIIAAFKERLESREWLDDFTRHQTLEKVDGIVTKIAFPEWIFNDTHLNSLSAGYTIFKDSYFRTVLEAKYEHQRENWGALHNPVNRRRWCISPIVPNAFYTFSSNEVIFLAAFLLPPLVHPDWPDYYNYGALGTFIGHELTHGFDDQGQQYNANGNYQKWWSDESICNFQERKKCFVDQYYNYMHYGSTVDGNNTLGENIADNGGLMTAYYAYNNLPSQSKDLTRLPGLKYTPEQIFFIAQAQAFCSVYDADKVAEIMATSRYSPEPYRVIGPLSNSKAFSEIFKCPAGSNMNPTDKCVMW